MENDCFPWPEDMERRRLADLELFALRNLDCEFPEQHREAMTTAKDGHVPDRALRKLQEEIVHRNANCASSVPSVKANKWSLATTLELLEVMKAFVQTNKVPLVDRSLQHWEAMAKSLSNPEGLELKQHARSCQVRIANIRRSVFEGKGCRIQDEVLQSLEEFYQICKLHNISSSKRPIPKR